MNPRFVISAMRTIKRQQDTSGINKEVKDFIFETGLMRQTLWPAWCISISDSGIDYIRENEPPVEEYGDEE